MLKAILCNRSVSRVEIDQRARDARLRLEQIERLLVSRAPVTASSLSRVLCFFGFARPGEGWRASRTRGPLNNQRPRVPKFIRAGSRDGHRRDMRGWSKTLKTSRSVVT